MKESSTVKIWLTCPEDVADTLRVAIGDAGIGQIENYSHCSFVTKGKGYFKPNDAATPHIGATGDIEEVALDAFPLLDIEKTQSNERLIA